MGKVATVGVTMIILGAVALGIGYVLLNESSDVLNNEDPVITDIMNVVGAEACCGPEVSRITFGLKNTGAGDMVVSSIVSTFESNLLLVSLPITIPAGETQVFQLNPKSGSTLMASDAFTVTITLSNGDEIVFTESDVVYG